MHCSLYRHIFNTWSVNITCRDPTSDKVQVHCSFYNHIHVSQVRIQHVTKSTFDRDTNETYENLIIIFIQIISRRKRDPDFFFSLKKNEKDPEANQHEHVRTNLGLVDKDAKI